jgi:type IV pilus assembly protein PilC
MPKYSFLAKSLEGKTEKGILEARDEFELSKILKEKGLILVRAEKEKEKEKSKFKFSFFSFGVSISEKMFFTRNLKIMISAGVPLPRALLTLSQQTKSKKFKTALEKISERIVKGEKFSDTLSSFPQIFNEFYQNMIKVAEETGKLEEVLEILARQLEREHELKSKIQGAMIYPAVIFVALIGVGVLMLVMVIPKLAETFNELGVTLPLTTRIVISLGIFLQKNFLIVFSFLLLFSFLCFRFLKTKIGKRIFDKISLHLPIFSSLIKKSNSASTARSLSSLISAGVSLPRALEITANTLGNVFYKEVLLESVDKVKKGKKLSECLKPYQNIYPLTLISMIEVGEETGETSEILSKIADFYESEVSDIAKNLTSIIEPVLMLIIGALVGFFAVSMVQPMYSMMQAIQ